MDHVGVRLSLEKNTMGYQGWGKKKSERGANLMSLWGLEREKGHIKIRPVRCKKGGCKTCPHSWYAYHISRYYPEKYLGTCYENGKPRVAYTDVS